MSQQTEPLVFDHLAVIAGSLEDGIAYVRDRLGVSVPFGGTHPRMGTHNGLTKLGATEFFEIIAIDPQAKNPGRPRWFGLDEWQGEPRLAFWVLGTPDIATSLQAADIAGEAVEMTRGDLTWLIAIAPDGRLPLDGAFPVLIQWPAGPHPAARMQDCGCRLDSLTIRHPQADRINAFLEGRLSDRRIRVEHGEPGLAATFLTPSGRKDLD